MVNNLWDAEREAVREILKEARLSRGMTQVELAKWLGKPQSYVSKYESGERRLDFVELLEVCGGLGMSYENFFNAYTHRLER